MERLPSTSPTTELDEIEAHAARASIAPMPVPIWFWPVLAICGSGFALGWVLGSVYGPLLASAFAFAAAGLSLRITRESGVIPDPRNQPRELTIMQALTVMKVVALCVAMILVGVYLNRWLAVALAGPLFALVAYRHDQRYEARTAELRTITT